MTAALSEAPGVRPQRVAERIVDGIRDQIRSGVLRPGDRLPSELDLCAELGVGRLTVREALRVLEAGGLVQSDKTGRVRTYRIAPDAFSGLEDWVAARKAQWHRQFDALEALLDAQDTP